MSHHLLMQSSLLIILMTFLRTVAISSDHQLASSFCSKNVVVPDVHFRFTQISVDKVVHQLLHLGVRKATGSDSVSAFFLKAVACEIAKPLTLIFNKSLNTGLVLSAWKCCNVSPVYKGGDKGDLGNFCPISVVLVVAKILEKLIASRLSSYLEHHNFLHEHQKAYHHGRSAEQILLFAVDTIVHALDQGMVVCAAFLI